MNKNRILKFLLITFAILSIIKFFSAKVGLLGDPTVQLVIKPNPTLSNSFMMKGEDNELNRQKYEGTWYYEGRYRVITGDESGFMGEAFYDMLIGVWWILCIGISIYFLIIKIKSTIKSKAS